MEILEGKKPLTILLLAGNNIYLSLSQQLCLLAKCLKPALPFLDADITDIHKEVHMIRPLAICIICQTGVVFIMSQAWDKENSWVPEVSSEYWFDSPSTSLQDDLVLHVSQCMEGLPIDASLSLRIFLCPVLVTSWSEHCIFLVSWPSLKKLP